MYFEYKRINVHIKHRKKINSALGSYFKMVNVAGVTCVTQAIQYPGLYCLFLRYSLYSYFRLCDSIYIYSNLKSDMTATEILNKVSVTSSANK